MNKTKRKTRARSADKKAKQFDRILEEGKEMFIKYGSHGFSTRALAQKLNMTQPNLYNYVSSKRELWIAIRSKYYNEYYKGIQKILAEHKGPISEVFYKFAEYYLEFAAEDYKRYQIMFVLSAPPSRKIGPLEKNYKPFQLTKLMLGLLKKAIDAKEMIPDEQGGLFYSLYSMIFGAAKIETDLKLKNNVTEPVEDKYHTISAKEFREYVLKEIRDRIERNRIK